MTEGSTKKLAYVMINPMKPNLVRPTRRITAISKVLVSTDISKSEYTRRHATMMKMIKRMSKINPISIEA